MSIILFSGFILLLLAISIAAVLLSDNIFSYSVRVKVIKILRVILGQLRFYEVRIFDKGLVPTPVTDNEKFQYTKRKHRMLYFFSLISFLLAMISMIQFLSSHSNVWLFIVYAWFTFLYYGISIFVDTFTRDFNFRKHKKLVRSWKPSHYPSVDVFLPTAGEPEHILENTWMGVTEMIKYYQGQSHVYVLDDSNRESVKKLVKQFGFNYLVRPNRGEYKKAGNLRYGFQKSSGEYIAIFDADFRPRYDFLDELLPYFDVVENLGIVQSPQFFEVHKEQNWLERGAGAVQELFYRHTQVTRQSHSASICVGSNAVYKRLALNDTGGTALVEHSEDVHTGFNLRMHGWTIQYVPVNLAKGLCPADMTAFFKQQYRWCRGSMSLLMSEKFWATRLKLRTRLCYIAGFLYYLHTAIASIMLPILPIIVLWYWPYEITPSNYLLLLPSFIFAHLIFPLWHDSTYGIEAWSTRMVYGWAHLFAIFDTIRGTHMQWSPTGAKTKKDFRYLSFRILQVLFNLFPAAAWVVLACWRMSESPTPWYFAPILYSGMYYFFISMKVAFYYDGKLQLHISPERRKALST